jgi:hypothetical protein
MSLTLCQNLVQHDLEDSLQDFTCLSWNLYGKISPTSDRVTCPQSPASRTVVVQRSEQCPSAVEALHTRCKIPEVCISPKGNGILHACSTDFPYHSQSSPAVIMPRVSKYPDYVVVIPPPFNNYRTPRLPFTLPVENAQLFQIIQRASIYM